MPWQIAHIGMAYQVRLVFDWGALIFTLNFLREELKESSLP